MGQKVVVKVKEEREGTFVVPEVRPHPFDVKTPPLQPEVRLCRKV